MNFQTADLCDAFGDQVEVAAPILRDFGGVVAFWGPIATVDCAEDNTSVRAMLEQPGLGRVLVVDSKGSLRCALVGDQMGQLAIDNGWAGIVIHGCVRDTVTLAQMPIGVKALASNPRRSDKRVDGLVDVDVTFAGVTFKPGQYLYADADGVIVSAQALLKSSKESATYAMVE